ncbi:hypothetical protein DVJ78_00440 [Humibacter sp. BT305]|nr:hypothetical protein DVJ78_00440 [Humibacter sp. BT305]
MAAAVAESGARSIAMIQAWRGERAIVIAERFLAAWRMLLTGTEFRAGCAVLAVTTSTDSSDVLDDAGSVFRSWREELASLLAEGGLAADRALAVATMLIASAEGAVVMSRAERRIDPFDEVAAEVLARVTALVEER